MEYEKCITIEGLNGSGKATQTQLLLDYLRDKYGKAETIEFPVYDSGTGKLLLDYLHKEKHKNNIHYNAMLYELNRYEVLPKMLKILEEGKWLLLDRYIYSNWVFQGILSGDNEDFVQWIKDMEKYLPKPKHKIFLDVPVEITINLMKDKKKDWHEKDTEFMKKVYKKYKEIAEKDNWIIINCVDSNKNILPKEEIHKKILKELNI